MGKLTARTVKSIKGAGFYNDGNGLYLQVRPPEGRSWILRTRIHGTRRDIGLGSAQLVSLVEAREEATRLRKIARQGGDPLAERRTEIMTFGQAASGTFEAKRKGWKNAKQAQGWWNTIETYVFPRLKDRDVATIRSADVVAVLAPIWHDKPETARRIRQRMSAIINWAKVSGHFPLENPVDAVGTDALGAQKDKTKHHDAMPWRDTPAFFAELAKREAVSARALEMCILCANRWGEIRFAKWSEFDLDDRVWVIPAERMKGLAGKEIEHRIPLSDAAVAVLEKVTGLGETYVFPSAQRSNDGLEKPQSENAALALLKRMEIEATVHGFRSTFRDWGSDTAQGEFTLLETCLAHKVGNAVSQAYARSDLLEKRRPIMQSWADYLTAQCTVDQLRPSRT